jgi:hypothetical protein
VDIKSIRVNSRHSRAANFLFWSNASMTSPNLLTAQLVPVNLAVKLRTLPTIFVLLIMSAVFLRGQTPSGAETGIEGVIMISPSRPGPIRADTPGSMPLANTAFMVENQTAEVASFTTDDQGHFHTSVPPGHYKVSIKGRKSSIGHFGPFEVDVASGKMTKVQWECDSGIR